MRVPVRRRGAQVAVTVHETSEVDVLGIHLGLSTDAQKELTNEDNQTPKTVSYTHLTLPTILLV